MSCTPRHTRPIAAATLATAVCLVVAGCSRATAPEASPASTPADTARAAEEVRLAAIGDSITQADGDVPNGVLGQASWLSTAVTGGVVFAGGWAQAGATTADMLAAAQPVDADVLVVLAGTNDSVHDLPPEETAENIRGIVERVGAADVVVSAVPPWDADPAVAVATNDLLEDLAADEGWVFADPMAGIRQDDRFAPGMGADGVHPSERGAAVIGAALREAVLEVAGR